jgi:AcrR family transcriptional regulator
MSVTTRPGGRSARVRASVHQAVEELLAEGLNETLTLPAIAARAGVHPTTLYRRWGSLTELLGEVASSRFSGNVVVPDTGSLHGDLTRWAQHVATDLADPDVIALMRANLGTGPEGGNVCVADRQEQLAAMLDRERARGGRPPTPQHAADALLGPLYYRALFVGGLDEPGWVTILVDTLLAS